MYNTVNFLYNLSMADAIILQHKKEFEDAIANLHVSERAQKALARARMVALSGVAGGGRNTVINYLVEHYPQFQFMISDTTRPPKLRNGVMEKHGVNYYFRTEEEMLHDIRAGEFIEAEIIHNQQVSGTSVREIERATDAGKIAVNDFEYLGAQNIHTIKPDAIIIGLVPPSYDEWIHRLRNREEMSEQEFLNRMETARSVLRNMLDKPYFRLVINDTVERCAADVVDVVVGTYNSAKEERAREVAEQLLNRVSEELQLAV